MAVRIKLGDFQSVSGDCLGRAYIGCFPRMSEDEAWQAGRGVWKMNRSRAAAERFALVAGMEQAAHHSQPQYMGHAGSDI